MKRLFENRNYLGLSEFIPNNLLFVTVRNPHCLPELSCNEETSYFTMETNIYEYESLYGYFGPPNISTLYEFCQKCFNKLVHFGGPYWPMLFEKSVNFSEELEIQIQRKKTQEKIVVFWTEANNESRANAAFLIGSFAILYLGYNPCQVLEILAPYVVPFRDYQDASFGNDEKKISLLDCFQAIQCASKFGFFNFNDFNHEEFKYRYGKKQGHLTWIVPGKLLSFPAPLNGDRCDDLYIAYFKARSVKHIIALNGAEYDTSKFIIEGIQHHVIEINPDEDPEGHHVCEFFKIVEGADKAVAVHGHSGEGRSGTLIAAYLIKHYKMSAKEAVAWVRICRPGSVKSSQQQWLECNEDDLRRQGDAYRMEKFGCSDTINCHCTGICSYDLPIIPKSPLI